jgi:ubiquinone/menaquinone biosynthesis C-methylase UbiE
MDASGGMLEQAKKKLVNAIDDKIVNSIVQNKLPKIPFEDDSFDAVLFSLVSILRYFKATFDFVCMKQFLHMCRLY